jgi:hypothetical protein
LESSNKQRIFKIYPLLLKELLSGDASSEYKLCTAVMCRLTF